MNIFVGNLSFQASESDLKNLFEGFGNVTSAVIVMSKDKKTPKSRGFGFVEMPDEGQAFAAIAALNNKEFMGRVVNVDPSRPKTEAERESELKKRMEAKAKAKAKAKLEQRPREEVVEKKAWFIPALNKPGRYKGGRRTRSYVKRQGVSGMQEGAVRPLREKTGGELRPWKKSDSETKPWRKPEDGSKPWRKSEGGSKPWKKAEGEIKPWKKSEGEPRPWKKSEAKTKPWGKSSAGPKKSGFKSRGKPGGYKKHPKP